MADLPKLTSNPLSELFSTEAEREDKNTEKIYQLPCSELNDFENHPYKVLNDDKMTELIESIRTSGVINPLIVRPTNNGNYEIISGHRRKFAGLKAGLHTLPCIIRNLTPDEATILMVDSNSQREEILPSEKAFAYKMKMEALNHQGQTCGQVGHKSREDISETDSGRQVQRYIRLTFLIPDLLQMVDNKKIAFSPAVELSFLSEENQYVLLDCIEANETTPSHAQAIHLKKLSQEGKLTASKIEEVMQQLKPNQKPHISLSVEKFSRYFPSNYSQKQIEEGIFKALDFYKSAMDKQKKPEITNLKI